jgi:hypothetical protein
MGSSPTEKLKFRAAVSAVIAVVISALLYAIGNPTIILQQIKLFNSTVTTIFGLLFTILAIVYTFESQFESNRAMKILKNQGKYSDIIEIFYLAVAVIGLIWLYTFTIAVFQVQNFAGENLDLLLSFLSIFGYVLLIERLSSCFYIFVLLDQAIKSTEDQSD